MSVIIFFDRSIFAEEVHESAWPIDKSLQKILKNQHECSRAECARKGGQCPSPF